MKNRIVKVGILIVVVFFICISAFFIKSYLDKKSETNSHELAEETEATIEEAFKNTESNNINDIISNRDSVSGDSLKASDSESEKVSDGDFASSSETFDEAVTEIETENYEPVTLSEVDIKNIYLPESKESYMRCFDKDAISYSWEIYDYDMRDYKAVDEKLVSFEKDELNRSVSCFKITGRSFNQMVKCIIKTADQEKIQTAYVFPLPEIEKISIAPEIEVPGARYISCLDIPIHAVFKDGSEADIQGLSELYILNEEEISSETKVLPSGKRKTVKTIEITECEYTFIGVEEKTIELSYFDTRLSSKLIGTDHNEPDITDVKLDYDISNKNKEVSVDIRISAEDDITPLPNLKYAFVPAGTKIKDEDYMYSDHFNILIKKNGKYTVYVKDDAGNIAKDEVEIVTVDTKPPKISAVKLEYEEGWHNINSIIIDATDGTNIKYATSHKGDAAGVTYGDNNVFTIQENGTYTVYVMDAAGNISTQDITVGNIDTSLPVINNIKELR